MIPTTTGKSNHLEGAGLTLVTCESVHQVESGQHVKVHRIQESLASHQRLRVSLRTKIEICIESDSEYSSQILTNAETSLRSNALHETLVTKLLHRSCSTCINTDVPIVLCLVCCNSSSLGTCRSCQHSCSHYQK